MDPDLDEVRNNFNAVLTSGGGRLEERQFIGDYRALVGGQVPYQKYGHRDLDGLVRALGGFYFTKNSLGQRILNAGFDEKTAHITKLISSQKRKPGDRRATRKRPAPFSRPKGYRSEQLPRRQSHYTPVYAQQRPTPPVYAQQRPAPPPKYKNPPIIPQRQPFSVQSRLVPEVEPPPKTVPSAMPVKPSAQDRLSREVPDKASFIDVKKAHNQILSVESEGKVSRAPKESSVVEPEEDASFVDIQWLQCKVSKGKQNEEVAEDHRAAASAPVSTVKSSKGLPFEGASSSRNSVPPRAAQQATPPPSPQESMNLPTPSSAVLPVAAPAPLMSITVGKPRNHTRPLEQKVVFKSHVDDLARLVTQLGLGPVQYKFVERRLYGNKIYTAKINIGEHISYTSYPDEKPSQGEAQESVAQLAAEDLRKQYSSGSVKVALDSSEPVNECAIQERVYNLINTKTNGMFEEAIAQEYLKEYKMPLPNNWLDILVKSSNFMVDRFFNQKSIIYPVLQPVSVQRVTTEPTEPSNVIAPTPPSVKPSSSPVGEKVHVDINANTVNSPRKLPDLKLPSDDTWDVFVSSVSSDDLFIWVRLIGEDYDAKYNDAMNNLELKMFNDSQTATNPLIDDYYVVKFDNCWLRVQLKEIHEDSKKCDVFLIDNGEEDTIAVSELKVLSNEFLELPAQAVRCELSYVDLSYMAAQTYVLDHVIGNSFVAELLRVPTEDSCASVVLYNTEVEAEVVNINSNILDEIVKTLSHPQLPERGLFKITHLEKETPPFVQIKGKDLSLLEKILDDVSRLDFVQLFGVNAHPRLTSHNQNMYLARSQRAPSSWRRGTIVNTTDPKNPTVYFVDYGYSEKVMWSEVFDIDKVLTPLKKLPVQAVQIQLFNLETSKLTHGIIRRIRELVSPDVFVSGCKRTDGLDDKLPSIEFLVSIASHEIMCSINSDLVYSFDRYNKEDEELIPNNESANSLQRGSCGSTNPLPLYVLPSISADYFDIFVSMSSNPFNFMVQPLNELHSSFHDMMREMQAHYELQHTIMPVPAEDDLVACAAFVAKHPDDLLWYRVSIVAVLNSSSASVRYDDYGDIGVVTIDSLRYLEQQFRHIPSLAIRAKLHGVKPKSMDWSAEECVYFNNLIENKPFVSKVIQNNCEGGNNTWRVSLELIDTSKEDEDVNVANVLVENGIAVLSS